MSLDSGSPYPSKHQREWAAAQVHVMDKEGIIDEMRKEKAAARRDSHSPKPQAAMPKYGLKKPNDEKKQNTVIKRPVRRGDGAGF